MVSNDALRDSSSNGIDLRCDTSSLDSDANVKVAELVLSNYKYRFENLQSQCLGLDVLDRLPIDLDESAPLLCKRNSGCCLFPESQRTLESLSPVRRYDAPELATYFPNT